MATHHASFYWSGHFDEGTIHWLLMHKIKPYIKTLCFAASIFILDAVILNQGFVAVVLILLALFVFFPFALLLRRRDRRKYEQRLVKIAIYVLTGVAVLGSNTLQNRIADRRAIAIGNACLAYRAKYHQYPAELEDLVPEFLPSVPVAKWGGEHFNYSRALDPDREPMLYYAAVPPFGRRFYHMESGGWGYLD
jgi:hypothetical protein